MKVGWVVLGVVVATILLATIWSIGNGLTAATRFQEGATRDANRILPLILKDWSVAELRSNAAPELLENVSEAEMTKMMTELKGRFGAMKKLEPAQLGNFETPGIKNEGGPFMVAPFTALGHFEKGDAVVELKLVRSEGKWRVGNFFVRSPKAAP